MNRNFRWGNLDASNYPSSLAVHKMSQLGVSDAQLRKSLRWKRDQNMSRAAAPVNRVPRRSRGPYSQQGSGRHGISSAEVRGDGTVGSNMGYGYGVQPATEMGDFFSSGLRQARIPKTSQRPTTLGQRIADDWLQNLDQQRDPVPTSGLGTVGGRVDVVGLGIFGYLGCVRGCSSGACALRRL